MSGQVGASRRELHPSNDTLLPSYVLCPSRPLSRFQHPPVCAPSRLCHPPCLLIAPSCEIPPYAMDYQKGHAHSTSIGQASDMAVSPPAHPSRSNSSSSVHRTASHGHVHRQSFAENLRGVPPSPRSQRHPSLTQAAIQDLLNYPPAPKPYNPRFTGRDWRDVHVGELVSREDVRWVEMDTSVEDATMVRYCFD
jgi:hypothetical protein